MSGYIDRLNGLLERTASPQGYGLRLTMAGRKNLGKYVPSGRPTSAERGEGE